MKTGAIRNTGFRQTSGAIKTTLQFILPNGKKWVVSKEFTSDKHKENFINHLIEKKNYLLDEEFKQ